MKIKTQVLKEMLSKAVQGAGNDKMIPITQLIGINVNNNSIMLTTCTGNDYLYVIESLDDADVEGEIDVTPYVEQFAKLISKMTSEYIYLAVKDNGLEVKGNGTYMLELQPDEDGELIIYPDPYHSYISSNKIKFAKNKIKLEDIKLAIESVKPSLANTDELPAIKNYYVGDKLLATDKKKIASYNKQIINSNVLMSLKLVDLLGIMQDDIQYYIADDVMIFKTDNCIIYSSRGDDVEDYPVAVLDKLVTQKFASICKVNKNSFIALLERITLFVGKYDDNAIRLYFEKDGIRVANKSRDSNEVIEYVSSTKYKSYDCVINASMLLDQLRAYRGDIVEIHYNNDKAIKFVEEDLVQIIALMIVS